MARRRLKNRASCHASQWGLSSLRPSTAGGERCPASVAGSAQSRGESRGDQRPPRARVALYAELPPARLTRSRIPARPKPRADGRVEAHAVVLHLDQQLAVAQIHRPGRCSRGRAWRRWSAPPGPCGRRSPGSRVAPGASASPIARARRRSRADLIAVALEQRIEAGTRPSSSSAAGRSSVMIARRFVISCSICAIAERDAPRALGVAAAARRGEQHP